MHGTNPSTFAGKKTSRLTKLAHPFGAPEKDRTWGRQLETLAPKVEAHWRTILSTIGRFTLISWQQTRRNNLGEVGRDGAPVGLGAHVPERVARCGHLQNKLVFKAHRPLYHSTLGLRVILVFGVWGERFKVHMSPSASHAAATCVKRFRGGLVFRAVYH